MKFDLQHRIPINTMARRGGPGYCYALNWVDPSSTDPGKQAKEEKDRIVLDPWGIHKMPKSLSRSQQGRES